MPKQATPFLLTAAVILLSCGSDDPIDAALGGTERIAVKTLVLEDQEAARAVNGTGILTTADEVRHAFKIGGVIDRIYVDEGDIFTKGSLLATLKTDEIDAGLAQAQLGLDKAQRDLTRVTNLFRDSVATLEQYQNAQTAFDLAKEQRDAISFNSSYAYVYADFDGFVTKKMANEGEIVAAGSPILATNATSKAGWVLRVGVSDKDWAVLTIGDSATVELDAYPNQSFTATVHRKGMAADPVSGSFQIELTVDLKGLTPAIGMFGRVHIQTHTVENFKRIPYDALIEANGTRASVFVPLPDGKVRRQAIEIADFDNEMVKVKAGLETITEIIVSNSAFLNENSEITIIK